MKTNTGYLTARRTAESDECYTPRYAVIPIVKYLKARGYKRIWCPFDLDHSLYVRVLKDAGFTVINTHINLGEDFFTFNINKGDYDCIVSNPPFTLSSEVLEHLYELGKPFAMLLPINKLQSKERTPLFVKNGLELLTFDKRICFYTEGKLDKVQAGVAFASGYFCKDVLPEKLVCEVLEENKNESYWN